MNSPIKKIMVFIDGSEQSITAAQFALSIGKFTGADIIAFYVINTKALDDLLKARIFLKEEQLEYEHDLEEDAKRYLNHVREIAREKGINIETKSVMGSVHREVAKAVKEEERMVVARREAAEKEERIAAARRRAAEKKAAKEEERIAVARREAAEKEERMAAARKRAAEKKAAERITRLAQLREAARQQAMSPSEKTKALAEADIREQRRS